jgi:hypothetical protein
MKKSGRQRTEARGARSAVCLVCLGLLGIPVYAWHGRFVSGADTFISFPYEVAALGVFYLIGVWIAFRSKPAESKTAAVYIVLFFAVLYRLLLVPGQPTLSSDMYRYIWDGRVQARGINPYRYAPANKALEPLQDEAIYPHLNRHASPTIYPAGAQILFYTLNRLEITSVSGFKGVVVLFDIGSILVLTTLLAKLGFARERVLVYAWHPLVVFELGASGHLEGFVVFFVLLSLLLLIKARPLASVSSLALAASLKLYPAVILPAVLRDNKLRGCFLFAAILFLLYLPYLGIGKGIAGFLPEYLGNPGESFNLGLKAYLLRLFPSLDPLVFTGIFAVIFLVAAGTVSIKAKDTASTLKLAYILAGLYLVFATASLHPWYVIWIVPFLAFFPSPAWLYFTFAVSLSYLAYASPAGALPEWVRHVEYVPFLILLLGEYAVLLKSTGASFMWSPAGKKDPQSLQEPD